MARKPSGISERKSRTRQPNPKVLIVCEGETEVLYFDLMRIKYHLRSVVVVKLSGGSAAISVAESAIELNQEQIDLYGPSAKYERVFCVYDVDENTTLAETKQKINKHGFTAIISDVCFEYWFILHYTYSRAPFFKKEKLSASDMCTKQLKKHIKDYKKTTIANHFDDLYLRLVDKAIPNAKKSLEDAELTNQSNPSTNVHTLILFLQNLKKES